MKQPNRVEHVYFTIAEAFFSRLILIVPDGAESWVGGGPGRGRGVVPDGQGTRPASFQDNKPPMPLASGVVFQGISAAS